MKQSKWFGRRVVKTGLSVFITAMICKFLDLPVIFAVITAIVTTEPTAADSIKKGLIRLPAAALGALFAILIDLLLGGSAMTYALVAMLTIITCARFKLDNGTLVATLTAVAMIPGTSEGILADLIFRLSGTTIGIMVSTLVNYVVLPPKFGPILVNQLDSLFGHTGEKTAAIVSAKLTKPTYNPVEDLRFLNKQAEKAFQLLEYQKDEWKYRSSKSIEIRSFQFLEKKIEYLQQIISQLTIIAYQRYSPDSLTSKEKDTILNVSQSLSDILQDPLHIMTDTHYTSVDDLRRLEVNNDITKESEKLYVLLLSLHEVTEGLADLTAKEKNYSLQDQAYPKYIFADRIQYD